MIPQRLMARIVVRLSTGCWLWTGELNRNGYGRLWHEGKRYMAHKFFFCAHLDRVPQAVTLNRRYKRRKRIRADERFILDEAVRNVRPILSSDVDVCSARSEDHGLPVRGGSEFRHIREVARAGAEQP